MRSLWARFGCKVVRDQVKTVGEWRCNGNDTQLVLLRQSSLKYFSLRGISHQNIQQSFVSWVISPGSALRGGAKFYRFSHESTFSNQLTCYVRECQIRGEHCCESALCSYENTIKSG